MPPFFREMLRYIFIAGALSLLTQRPVISRMEKSVEVEQESVILHGLDIAFRFLLAFTFCYLFNSQLNITIQLFSFLCNFQLLRFFRCERVG